MILQLPFCIWGTSYWRHINTNSDYLSKKKRVCILLIILLLLLLFPEGYEALARARNNDLSGNEGDALDMFADENDVADNPEQSNQTSAPNEGTSQLSGEIGAGDSGSMLSGHLLCITIIVYHSCHSILIPVVSRSWDSTERLHI